MIRKIIHIDADAFYASVEMRERPELRTAPIAVGGQPGSRGVIATCNYAARAHGVRSAMPSAHAVRLCPDLIILKPRFELYRAASRQMHAIFRDYTETIEPVALDEAYLDVTSSTHFEGSATRMAEAIRERVKNEIGVTVSAGVAPNKFLAKVASDWRKPDGLFVIRPNEIDGFVPGLPVRRINGVGQVTAEKLAALGVETCQDLQRLEEHELLRLFGRQGPQLYRYARGQDDRPVNPQRTRKSLSCEHTYASNLKSLEELLERVPELCESLLHRWDALPIERYRIRGRFVKLRFDDFRITTLEQSISGSRSSPDLETQCFISLVTEAWQRRQRPVRLIGLGFRLDDGSQTGESGVQLSLF